jgi:major membrane immunogen (membrane-anchored lipoprotein)
MKKTMLMLGLVILYLIAVSGCNGKPKVESRSDLFKDYVQLENSLPTVTIAQNKSIIDRYEKFLKKYKWDGDVSKMKDGVYESYSTDDAYGFIHYVRVTVTKGTYASVYYDEFKPGDKVGKRKSETYGRRISIDNPDILKNAFSSLESSLLAKQNPLKVDVVTGATIASWRFRVLVLKAVYEGKSNRILNTKLYTEGPAL